MRKKHGKTAHPGTLAGTPNGSLTLDLVTVLFQLQHAETISLKYFEIIPNSYSQTFPDRLEAWKPLRFAGPRSNIWASSKGVTAPSSSKPGRNEACENQQTNSNMEKKHETTTILQHEIEMESVIVTDNWLPYARTSARSLNTLKQLDLPCRTLLKEETWLNHVTRYCPATSILYPCMRACAHACKWHVCSTTATVATHNFFFRPHAQAAFIIEVCRCQLRLDSGLVFAAFWRSHFSILFTHSSLHQVPFVSSQNPRFKPVNLYQICGQSKIG